MCGLRDILARAVMVSIAGTVCATEVNAQTRSSSSATSSTSTSSTSTSSSTYTPFIMPFPFMMNSGNSSGLSPNDAAALGTSGTSGTQSGNIFNNPWASPFLFSGMTAMQQGGTGTTTGGGMGGMVTGQLGLMMMANQQMGGIGSGQLSGVRPGAGGLSRSRTGKPVDPKTRRNVSQPAGLAAHYFSRTTITNPKSQVYYNRPSSHYPQATH
jgi:hypothetical protein